MSLAEILYRARGTALSAAQRINVFTDTQVPHPDLSVASSGRWLRHVEQFDPQLYVDAAEHVLGGHISVFALADTQLGSTPRWNRDPRTGREAPLRFGKTLDYRDENLVGDIKYLWEPNRHLQLVTLAQAYRLTDDDRYLNGIRLQLTSWFDQCPYLKGPNWASSLELAIRLINWSIVWRLIVGLNCQLFLDDGGNELRDRWLSSIHQHLHFIAGHLSRYSSSNNHLIGEAAGLFIGACTWPHWPITKDWKQRGYDTLLRQALLQNSLDGVNREQAVSYQQFVLDFLIVSALVGRDAGVEFPADFWKRIEAMLEYLASIMDVCGNVPMIGDSDDGYVLQLAQQKDFCPYRSLLATGALLFQRPEFKHKAGSLDDKTRWLLGDNATIDYSTLPAMSASALPMRRAFPEGGYYILGDQFETAEEIRLLVDCGPLGYLSIAAHGHADALSLMLSVGGREFLVDPGTFAYHTMRRWRDYFRGTSAHNTVRIDGLDQSEIGGNFMWVRHAQTRCEKWELGPDMDRFSGSHDGYGHLPDPVTHRRDLCLNKLQRSIQVTDILECHGQHRAERFWHFSEHCRVRLEDNAIVAINDGVQVRISPQVGNVNAVLLNGDESSPGGWISRRFDVKQPTTTVVWSSEIDGTTTLSTEIRCII